MPTHIVAAAGLVTNCEGKVLLVKSPRRGWEFPGGQVEVGESLTEACLREIREESGITARVTGVVGVYSNTSVRQGYNGVALIPTIVNLDFLCEYVSGELALSDETVDAGWFTREEALRMVTYPVFAQRLQNMLRYDGGFHCEAFRLRPGGQAPAYEWTERQVFYPAQDAQAIQAIQDAQDGGQ